MARPRLKIDPRQVEQLAAIGCSYAEIAAVVGCSHDTIERRFALVIKEGHEKRNASVRRAQYEVGVKNKNATMLIWLGKQFLGQTDKIDYSNTSDADLIAEAKRLFGGNTEAVIAGAVGVSPYEP
jgi:hypothetical protein